MVQRPYMDRSGCFQINIYGDVSLKTFPGVLHLSLACVLAQSTWQTWWMGMSCTTALLGALHPKPQTWRSWSYSCLLIHMLDNAGMR